MQNDHQVPVHAGAPADGDHLLAGHALPRFGRPGTTRLSPLLRDQYLTPLPAVRPAFHLAMERSACHGIAYLIHADLRGGVDGLFVMAGLSANACTNASLMVGWDSLPNRSTSRYALLRDTA